MSFDERIPRSSGIFAEIASLQQRGRRAVLASPLWSQGSVPFSRQAKLLVRDDGSILGTIGGGALEAAVLEAAPAVLDADRARVVEFDLTESDAAARGMICGGRCAVLLEPISPARGREVFAAAAQAAARGEPIVLITLLPAPSAQTHVSRLALTCKRELVGSTGDSPLDHALAQLAEEALSEGRPRFLEDPVPVHIDPLLARPSVFIFGGGHLAVPLAMIADLVGFRVVVVDDREEFANRQRFPWAEEVFVGSVSEAFAHLAIGADARAGQTYIVAVTRGHAFDEEVVAHSLRTPARYIGMIGSKRKVASVLGRLRNRGFPDQDLNRVHAPIGLDIGADTVEEIAVSIAAQLIAARRAGVGVVRSPFA